MACSVVTLAWQSWAVRPAAAAEDLVRIMKAVAAGDQKAFTELYDATSPSVFGIVLSVLRDYAQAQEVTQEVYVDAWRTARRFDPILGTPFAWLNTIAHRRAVDRVRSVERASRREHRDAQSSIVYDVLDTADVVVAADEGRRVRDALSVLSDVQCTAVQLAYYEGRSYREVAEYLELPLGTVKTRIRDGLKRLRTQLEASS
jgi:RNA polymerase sigma-70 factor, ECF subfamily